MRSNVMRMLGHGSSPRPVQTEYAEQASEMLCIMIKCIPYFELFLQLSVWRNELWHFCTNVFCGWCFEQKHLSWLYIYFQNVWRRENPFSWMRVGLFLNYRNTRKQTKCVCVCVEGGSYYFQMFLHTSLTQTLLCLFTVKFCRHILL